MLFTIENLCSVLNAPLLFM